MSKFQKRRSGGVFKTILLVLLIVCILTGGFLLWYNINFSDSKLSLMQNQVTEQSEPPATEPPTEQETTEPEITEPPTTLPPEPEHVVSRATIAATGDMLMHLPLIDSAKQSDGSYNFDYMFQYLNEYSQAADYAVANLETTLCGNTNGFAYSGFPQFNCPDEIVDGLKNAGFDMLLTANNHSYDTGETGFFRTIETIRNKGLETLGTMLNGDEPKYTIQNINGINIGMLCYTYEGHPGNGQPDRIYLNGLIMHPGAEEVVNTFLESDLDPFYAKVEESLAEMKAAGAEATVMFIHWGVEYTRTPVAKQTEIAQRLCDMGIDVIVGGHPHVVEPITLLTSNTNPDHKTVCLYSMGNAISNQRAGVMVNHSSGHTEDGVWFRMTFSKYSDDTVYLEDVDLTPTWLKFLSTNGWRYYILPLDDSRKDDWAELLELDKYALSSAQRSYDRTMTIVGAGLTEAKDYLSSQKDLREANYLAAVADLMNAS